MKNAMSKMTGKETMNRTPITRAIPAAVENIICIRFAYPYILDI